MYMGQRLLWVFSDSSLIFQLLIHVGHRYVKKGYFNVLHICSHEVIKACRFATCMLHTCTRM